MPSTSPPTPATGKTAPMSETAHAHECDARGARCRCPFPACWWNSTLAPWLSALNASEARRIAPEDRAAGDSDAR